MPPGGPSKWTPLEDEELRRLIDEYGPKKWSLIASKLKTKGSKQCRRRWKNYLNAELKQGGWSVEEDRILFEGHKKFGNRWTEIAKLVGGRTDNAVKNRWAALCKRNQRMDGKGTTTKRSKRPRTSYDDSDDDDTTPSSSPTPTPPISPRISSRRPGQQPQPQQPQSQPPVMAHALAFPVFQVNPHNPHAPVGGHAAAAAALAAAAEVVRNGMPMHAGASHGSLSTKRAAPEDPHQQLYGGARKLQRVQAVQGQTDPPLPHSPRRAFGREMRVDVPLRHAAGGAAGGHAQSPRGAAAGQVAAGSPLARKGKPQLTLLIPNAAAEPPRHAAANSVELHVVKELLSPAEVKYAQELNGMGMPLHISLGGEDGDPLEAPLTTSRRAAQDAVSAFVAGSPTTAALGPFSLIGGPPTGAEPSLAPLTIPSSTTSAGLMGGGGDISDLLRWLQQGMMTPHSTRTGGNPFSARGNSTAATAPAPAATTAAATAAGASPRPTTRSMSRGSTPRAGAAEASKQPGSGGSGAAAATTQTVMSPGGTLHDGHRQLLNKLLTQAKAGIESASGTPVSSAGTASTPRRSPRFPSQPPQGQASQGQASGSGQSTPPPRSSSSLRSPRSLTTSAQAAAAFAASVPMPSPLAHGSGSSRRTATGTAAPGRLQHASSAKAPADALASPAGGLPSARSGWASWADGNSVTALGLSMTEINALLDALASPNGA